MTIHRERKREGEGNENEADEIGKARVQRVIIN